MSRRRINTNFGVIGKHATLVVDRERGVGEKGRRLQQLLEAGAMNTVMDRTGIPRRVSPHSEVAPVEWPGRWS